MRCVNCGRFDCLFTHSSGASQLQRQWWKHRKNPSLAYKSGGLTMGSFGCWSQIRCEIHAISYSSELHRAVVSPVVLTCRRDRQTLACFLLFSLPWAARRAWINSANNRLREYAFLYTSKLWLIPKCAFQWFNLCVCPMALSESEWAMG